MAQSGLCAFQRDSTRFLTEGMVTGEHRDMNTKLTPRNDDVLQLDVQLIINKRYLIRKSQAAKYFQEFADPS